MSLDIVSLIGTNPKRERSHHAPGIPWKMESLRRPHGFTLVELLVVIAIVGILVAIAVPLYLHYAETTKV